MKQRNFTVLADRAVTLLLFLTGSFLILRIGKLLGCPIYEYDQCGQFFIAQGLNHFSAPFSAPQGLGSVIESNRYFNLDPGGFSVILHYWQMISTNATFLRLLPFLFFIGMLVCTWRLYTIEYKNTIGAFIVAITLLVFPEITDSAVNLRAYSMEMFGVMATLCLLAWTEHRSNPSRMLLLGIITSLFMTSRYMFILYAAALSAYVCISIFFSKDKQTKDKTACILAFVTPVLLTVAAIYLGMTSFQNADFREIGHVDYLNQNHELLFVSHLSIATFTVFLIGIVTLIHNRRLNASVWICIILSISVLFLSLIGKYPWDEKRAMSLHLLQCYVIVSSLCYIILQSKVPYIKTYVSILAIFLGMAYRVDYTARYSMTLNLPLLDEANRMHENFHGKKIFVSRGNSASVRFMYEYGHMKQKSMEAGYPENFVFGTSHTHNLTGRILQKAKYVDLNNCGICDLYFFTFPEYSQDFKKIDGFQYLYTRNTK